MRLLILNYEFPPLGGGGSSVCYNITKELVESGYEADVITMGYKGLKRFEVIDRIRVFRIPCLRSKAEICYTHEMLSFCLNALPLLYKLTKKNTYSLNHTHFIFPSGIIAYLLRKMTGLPYIITAHGSDVQGYNPHRFRAEHKMLKPLWKRVVHDAKEIVSPSQSLRALINCHYGEKPVTVIPNAVDINAFRPMKKEKNILMVSRLLERKGFQFAIQALAEIDTDFKATIVGDGPFCNALKQLARDKSVDLRFTGWLDNKSEELHELYEKASIFILPSEIENFSIALVEAMASGAAIITSDSGGCPEVVGDTALLVKPRNVRDIKENLIRLIDDGDLRSELGRKARKRVENNFTWQSVAKKYEKVYQKYCIKKDYDNEKKNIIYNRR
jgi:glycosyltransferase involved in cell wall biosynthesis